MLKPLKRHQSLQPISREHHHGLLLSFKIREGMKRKVDSLRMKKYTDWFWENQLETHFGFKEEYMFPILGMENELIIKAIEDHRRLKKLFLSEENIEETLVCIEEELVAHIRFEERVLFQEIQKVASQEQLQKIEEAHSIIIVDKWEDEFWKG